MCVCPHGNTERASEPEVSELQIVGFIDQKVLRFQVAMQDTMRVAVEQARRELMREFLRIGINTLVPWVRCCLPAKAWSVKRYHVTGVIFTSFT